MTSNNGWAFPDLNSIVEASCLNAEASRAPELDEKDRRLIELESILREKNEEIVSLTKQLAQLQALKSEEADRLIELTKAVHDIIPLVKSEIVDLVSDMVKKISHKVLQREMVSHETLMMELIQAYINELGQSELIQIEVNPTDYERMKQLPFDTKAKWNVNPKLEPGDVIVTSEVSGIRLVLDDLIHRMVSAHHE